MSGILNRDGLPVDFSKSPQDIANEINAKLGPNATPEQVQLEVDKVNAGARAAAQLVAAQLAPQQQQEEDPLEYFVQHFYSILTPELHAILGSGVPIRAVLYVDPKNDDRLTIDIHPAVRVKAIDKDAKRVIIEKGPDGRPVDPDAATEIEVQVDTSESCGTDCGCSS